jgi:hypothetical protein
MASIVNVSSLTLNPKETQDISKFIVEKLFQYPALQAIHGAFQNGVTMKQQIVFSGSMGKTGIGRSSCTRVSSGATNALTQKYWEPAQVADTFTHCQSDVDPLFKPYYNGVKKYEDLYDIKGSQWAKFIFSTIMDTQIASVQRYAWLGDTAVAASGASAAGLKAAGDVKFYDVLDGLWKQIFASSCGHTTTKLAALNALTSTATQTVLAAGDSVAVFEDMLLKADSRLRADASAQFLVSREIFDNYSAYLKGKGENFTIQFTTEGFKTLSYDGYKVVNMETVWDILLRSDFEQDSTNNAYYLPNRAIFTTPSNIPLASLNSSDMTSLENWYNQDDAVQKTAFGYTLDAKLLEDYMIVKAY